MRFSRRFVENNPEAFLISSCKLNQAVTETGEVFNLRKGSNYKKVEETVKLFFP